MIRKILSAVAVVAALCGPAWPQAAPLDNILSGRGGGVQGFKLIPPGASGNVLFNTGTAFQSSTLQTVFNSVFCNTNDRSLARIGGTWGCQSLPWSVALGGTGVTTFGGTNRLLYTTATDTLSSIATANNGVLITSAGGVPSISSTLPNAVQDAIVRFGTVTVGALNGVTVTGLPTCSAASDACAKAYIDSVAVGLTILSPVRLATAAVLPNTPTYANGASGVGATLTAGANAALTVDGTAAVLGDRVLVKDEASALTNGVYTVTTVGSGAAAWVLTRATDFDQTAEVVKGSYEFVTAGATNIGNQYVMTTTGSVTMGTTAINWSLFGSGTAFLAKSNNLSDLGSAATARTNLGLGTAATQATGTAGATIPFLSGTNIWSGVNAFPSNGLNVGTSQFGVFSGVVAVGTATPSADTNFHVFSAAAGPAIASFGPSGNTVGTNGFDVGYGGILGIGHGFLNAHSATGVDGKYHVLTDHAQRATFGSYAKNGGFTLSEYGAGNLVSGSSGAVVYDGTVNVLALNAAGLSTTTTGSVTSGTASLTLGAAAGFRNGQGIVVNHAGTASGLSTPTIRAVSTGETDTKCSGTCATSSWYRVAEVNQTGGLSQASAELNIASGADPAAMTPTNFNLVCVNRGSGTYFAIWRSATSGGTYTLLGFTNSQCFKDQGGTPGVHREGDPGGVGHPQIPIENGNGLGITRPFWIPTTPPVAALPNWHVTTVSAGGGTTSITLAANAGATVASEVVQHEDTAALQAAAAAAGGKTMFLPCGYYRVAGEITVAAANSIVRGQGRRCVTIEQNQYPKALFRVESKDDVTITGFHAHHVPPKTATGGRVFGEPDYTQSAVVLANNTNRLHVEELSSNKFVTTLSAYGRVRVVNFTASNGSSCTSNSLTLAAGDVTPPAGFSTFVGWRVQINGTGTNAQEFGFVSAYAGGVATLDRTVAGFPSSSNCTYVLYAPGYDTEVVVRDIETRFNDYAVLFGLQDRFTVQRQSNSSCERTQYGSTPGTCHAIYGTGDGIVLDNKHFVASDIIDNDGDGHTIKYRGRSCSISNVASHKMRYVMSIEQISQVIIGSVNPTETGGCTISNVKMTEIGGNFWDYVSGRYGGNSDANGIQLVGAKNVQISNIMCSISPAWIATEDDNWAKCVWVLADPGVVSAGGDGHSDNVSIRGLDLIVNSNNFTEIAFGVYISSTAAGTYIPFRTSVHGLRARNNGNGGMQGVFVSSGSGHVIMLPEIFDNSANPNREIVNFSPLASNSYAIVDPSAKMVTHTVTNNNCAAAGCEIFKYGLAAFP